MALFLSSDKTRIMTHCVIILSQQSRDKKRGVIVKRGAADGAPFLHCAPVSHVLYPSGRQSFICVPMHTSSPVEFPLKSAPTEFWVSSSWGLPVPPRRFPSGLVSVALLKVLTPRRVISQPSRLPTRMALWFPPSRTLQASQPVLAWTFLTSLADARVPNALCFLLLPL